MGVISVRLNIKEEKVIKKLAEYYDEDRSKLLKRSLFELKEKRGGGERGRGDIETIVNTIGEISAINNSGLDVLQKYSAMMESEQYQNILAASWQQ